MPQQVRLSSLRHIAICLLATLPLAALAGCGGSSSLTGISIPPGTNNAVLNGQYAFSFSGQNANGFLAAAGSFTADGNGNITNGQEDVNNGTGALNLALTGTYSIGTDGRGIALLNTSAGPATWEFTMLNGTHALMIRFDTFATASGTIDRQDATAFTNGSLQGNYVFGFGGLGVNLGSLAMAGTMTLDGAGGILSGVLDANDLGVVIANSPLVGNYSVASNGRGLASITSGFGTQTFVFYVISTTDLKFLETDALPITTGDVLRGLSGPFTNGSIAGRYAFTFGGESTTNLNPVAAGGLLTSDGNGNLSGFTLDFNNNGSVSTQSGTGAYTVNSAGRGSATFAGLQVAFYPAADGTLELTEIDPNFVTGGAAKLQAAGPFSLSTVSGKFALNFAGTNLNTVAEEDIAGQIAADGAGNLTGSLDINNSGNIFQGVGLGTASYTMPSNGRGTANISSSLATFSLNTYQVDANTVLFLEVDQTRVLTGIMQK